VELELKATLERDGRDVEVWMQQEPGSQSVALLDVYARTIFRGYTFRWETASTDKVSRAKPLSAANSPNPRAGTPGNVFVVRAPWNTEFTEELEAFPQPGVHDDQVDAASGAHQKLTRQGDSGTRFTGANTSTPA